MTAERAMRTARRRRWATSVPVIVALLFATTTTVAGTVGMESAPGSGHVPVTAQIVGASAQQAAGQRPDVPIIKRAGSWSVAHDLGALGWVSARSVPGPAGFWHRRHDLAGQRAQTRHETYQGRGPPGRRASHVLS
ncbi:MAG TPA: hypothetical protein VF657_00810 [Actinoplanes sp.]|jgi:hypothetical protein